jgi:hypothetical protein
VETHAVNAETFCNRARKMFQAVTASRRDLESLVFLSVSTTDQPATDLAPQNPACVQGLELSVGQAITSHHVLPGGDGVAV